MIEIEFKQKLDDEQIEFIDKEFIDHVRENKNNPKLKKYFFIKYF